VSTVACSGAKRLLLRIGLQVDTRVVTTRQAKGNSVTQIGVIGISRSAFLEDFL
jgi:hypothetical protein